MLMSLQIFEYILLRVVYYINVKSVEYVYLLTYVQRQSNAKYLCKLKRKNILLKKDRARYFTDVY